MLPRLLTTASLLTGALGARTVYDIAHKILDVKGFEDAVYDGAGAIEIDLTAWRKGETGGGDDPADTTQWWVDHDGDGDPEGYGDTALKLLPAIGKHGQGMLSFVVFDIKTPDHCKVDEKDCGMDALRAMAEEHILGNGIGVVWGFVSPSDAAGDGFKFIADNLQDDAAVRITGRAEEALDAFEKHGGKIPKNKRIIDYGAPKLGAGNPEFGKCDCDKGSDKVCPNIACAIEAKDRGEIGSVWMWTVGSSDGDGEKASMALDARADGIVYGYANARYEDSEMTRKAKDHVMGWIDNHDDLGKESVQEDRPWK